MGLIQRVKNAYAKLQEPPQEGLEEAREGQEEAYRLLVRLGLPGDGIVTVYDRKGVKTLKQLCEERRPTLVPIFPAPLFSEPLSPAPRSPAPLPPAPRSSNSLFRRVGADGVYNPSRSYSTQSLLKFSCQGGYDPKHRLGLAKALVRSLNERNQSHANRFKLSAALARVLDKGSVVMLAGANRGDSFFASMAVDLFLRDSSLARVNDLAKKFVEVLSHWVENIAPDRQDFPVQGAPVKRDRMLTWIQELKDDAPQSSRSAPTPPGSMEHSHRTRFASRMERIMRGQEGSRQQSVHADGVVEAGNEVLKLMQTQLRHRGLQSWNEVSKDVGHSSKGRADRFDIRRGLEHLSKHDINARYFPESKITPTGAFRTLHGYINHHANAKVAENLRDSSLLLLAEIGREEPCFGGCVQRIFAIPNGIDPAVSAVPLASQIKESVTALAVRLQNEMSDIFAGTELENVDEMEGVDEAVLGDIKVDMFKQRVSTELGAMQGIPASEYAEEVDKMAQGFVL